MTTFFRTSVPPYIRTLRPYIPSPTVDQLAQTYALDPDAIVQLASNENPRGPSPLARRATANAIAHSHRYPDNQALTAALANHLGVAPDMIVVGNGSNEVLGLIAQTFLRPNASAVSSRHAFPLYRILDQSSGASSIVVPARDYGHDLAAMAQAITPSTRVVWIANPNNPTGTFIPYQQVKSFVAAVPPTTLVVLDEAYYEYLDDADQADATRWIADAPNLVLVRTFSKIYGLAGLRVGYGIGSPQVISLLQRVRQTFNVSHVALAGAQAALSDTSFVAESRQLARDGRDYLRRELRVLGLAVLPAYGNFVTFAVPNATGTHASLLQRGVITRPLAAADLPSHLRVSVGLSGQNQQFIAALRSVL